ncbi:MAG TPA: phosphohistidine phosphatase SixA [bacterium]|nr:phosphohistidine phosphatase SixA [bacterium]
MIIYLVRHGKAAPVDFGKGRPLTDHGKAEVEQSARFVAENAPARIDVIRHSLKLRALQTAEIFEAVLNPEMGLQAVDGLSPSDDAAFWGERIHRETGSFMLVSHMPFLSCLVSCLITGDTEKEIVRFNTGSVLCMERVKDRWSVVWRFDPQISTE